MANLTARLESERRVRDSNGQGIIVGKREREMEDKILAKEVLVF